MTNQTDKRSPFVFIPTMVIFNKKKISNNEEDTAYTINNGSVTNGTPEILWEQIVFIEDKHIIWTHGGWYNDIDLTSYLKTVDADKKYMSKSGGSGSTTSTLSMSQNGSFNNFGNNGQAFNAVRDFSNEPNNTKWNSDLGTKHKIDAASFGVKDNGTTAFSHKIYDTFNKTDGKYTGAKNTAVLVFSGPTGLMYAKNTGSESDVTDSMYKYVGVIDSPDENQKVYSAKQTDGIIEVLTNRISDLEGQNEYLMNVINLLITKTGVTDEELSNAVAATVAQQSLTNIDEDIETNISNNTEDYSTRSTEPSYDNNNV